MGDFNKLLIVAGTGRNTGKTTFACSLISRFRDIQPVGLKISPHFHKPSEGLDLLVSSKSFNIYREYSRDNMKDSSKMLVSGAISAYYIQVYDDDAGEAFNAFVNLTGLDSPVICESPALRRYVKPGLFFIADSDMVINKKELGSLFALADSMVYPGEAGKIIEKVGFGDNGWSFTNPAS